jgi:hypothetical protein
LIGACVPKRQPQATLDQSGIKNYNGPQPMVSNVNRPLEPGPELTYEINNLSTLVFRNLNQKQQLTSVPDTSF